MRTKTKRTLSIAAVTLLLLGGGSIAFAYWSAGGSGTGTALSASNTPITVNQSTVITGLQPGGAAQTISGTFTNANTSPVYVTSVTAAISGVAKAGGAPAGTCDASDYTLASAVMTVGAEVPVGTTVGSWTGATIQFNNKTAVNQDACKGATVTLTYTIA